MNRNNIAARMGRWSASHWKTAVFGWLAFVAVALVVGMTVGKTAFGGNELVAITRRPRSSTGSGPPAQ